MMGARRPPARVLPPAVVRGQASRQARAQPLVPAGVSLTSPTDFMTCRCWETAERVTGNVRASSVAVAGAWTSRSSRVIRIGSPSTSTSPLASVIAFAS